MEGVNIYITGETRRRLPTREEIISTRFTNLEIRNIEIWIFLRFFLISSRFYFLSWLSNLCFDQFPILQKIMRETHYLAIILKS